MRIEHPYHEGELLVQQKAGEAIQGQQNGRVIADSILQGALKFISQQPMVVLGSVDAQQNTWASVLLGHPGFIRAVDTQTVEFDLEQAFQHPDDPFWTNIECEHQIGILVIELASRRRLRINGTVSQITSDKLCLRVLESYPNCPKYIQRRHLSFKLTKSEEVSRRLSKKKFGQLLTPKQHLWIESADTFFVASNHSTRGVDVSHRGGNQGFVQILDEQRLRIPDYAGNSMFNTLGNLVINPSAGLIFVDFERSRTLQLIGRATILWDLDDSIHPTNETNRYWNFEIQKWLETDLPQPLDCEFLDYSPHNPA